MKIEFYKKTILYTDRNISQLSYYKSQLPAFENPTLQQDIETKTLKINKYRKKINDKIVERNIIIEDLEVNDSIYNLHEENNSLKTKLDKTKRELRYYMDLNLKIADFHFLNRICYLLFGMYYVRWKLKKDKFKVMEWEPNNE